MRVESVSFQKGTKTGIGSTHKIPADGTMLRELYDHLQAHKGRPLVLASFMRKPELLGVYLRTLTDYYGLDIRNLGGSRRGHKGRGSMPTKYILAGEWFGRQYVDYIAQRFHP